MKKGILACLLAVAAVGVAGWVLPSQRPIARTEADREGSSAAETLAKATFAGGCFWCMEPPFDELDGVYGTTSGYIGGSVPSPSYEQVSGGGTGHAEAVQVLYDPTKVGYDQLLDVFWRNVDPTDAGGQFCDRGDQYRTGIFVHSEEQRQLALASKQELVASNRPPGEIVTRIETATPFYPAEEYHQDYYLKNSLRYKYYRRGCGRDRLLERLWGKAPH